MAEEILSDPNNNPRTIEDGLIRNVGGGTIRSVRSHETAIIVPIPGDGTVKHILPADLFHETSTAVMAISEDHARAFAERYGASGVIRT